MKLLVMALGPFLLWTKRHPKMTTRIMFVGAAITFAVVATINCLNRVSGWTKVTATVVRAGTKRLGDDNASRYLTVSLIRYGHLKKPRPIALDWTFRKGSHPPVWLRGHEMIASFPPSLQSDIGVPLVIVIVALLAILIVWQVLQSTVTQATYCMVIEAELGKPAPETIEELVAVMEANADVPVTYEDATSYNEGERLCCKDGVRDFLHDHFEDRQTVMMRELIPFVNQHNSRWSSVVSVVLKVLCDTGVIQKLGTYRIDLGNDRVTFRRG